MPPILDLVDNEALVYKARGCEVLSKLMKVIEISRSDVLRRTNLDLVFRDALESSLLSLPTLTPEKESLFILSRAYDAVIATLNARYLLKPDGDTQDGLRAFNAEDSRKRLEAFTSLLRERVLHSFNHICTMNNPGDDFIPSFPHPRLSTFLLQQIPPIVFVLKLHTVPLLEDIMSMLIPTLQNPFGSAYPPLLLAAVDATKATILMTWPRIWRWRVLILKGICDCWIQSHRQEEGTGPDSDEHGAICGLRDELRELTAVLKLAVRKCSTTKAVLLECEQEIRVDEEYELLVKEDSGLRDLLISNPYLET